MKRLTILLSLLLILTNCGDAHSPDDSGVNKPDYDNQENGTNDLLSEANGYSKNTSSTNKSSSESNQGKGEKPMLRKIIWNANLDFQVKDVDVSTDKISDIVMVKGGIISGMDVTNQYNEISNNIEVRIKNENFHSLIKSLKGESIFIKQIKINSNDVTEEFVDTESRLKTKKEVRDRYIDILRNKTGNIEDVLAAEEAIRKITEEIEAKEGKLRLLNDQIAMSTISIHIYQEVKYKSEPGVYEKPYSEEIADNFSSGWEGITNILLAFVKIWPLLLFFSILIFWKRKWIRSVIRELKKG